MSWWKQVLVYLILCIVFIVGYKVLDAITPDISKAKPIDDSQDTAILYIQEGLTLTMFDNKNIVRKSGFMAKTAEVNVPVGAHILVFDHKHSTSDGNTTTTYTANSMALKMAFESGKYYYVNWIMTPDKMVKIYWAETKEGEYLSQGIKKR